MLRIHFTEKDLLRSRFVPRPSPMTELVNALMLMQQDHGVFQSWRHLARAAFPQEAKPLLELAFPDFGPDYLDSLEPTFAGGLDDVLTTPPSIVRVPFEQPGCDRRPTPWVRRLADGEREAQQVLEKAVTSAYDALIVGQWPRLEASYQEDLGHRQRLMFTEGVEAALASVFPDARWNGLVLHLDDRPDRDIHLAGRGVTLVPSGFWAGRPAIGHGVPGRPLLIVYAARILLPFVDRMPSFPSGGRTLAPLMGRTRAAVLDTIVSSPAITTSALAQQLGISAGRASEHASVLRQAGLIMSHRHRNTVLHTPTTLGTDLNPS